MNVVESPVLKFKELPRQGIISKRRVRQRREFKVHLKVERDEEPKSKRPRLPEEDFNPLDYLGTPSYLSHDNGFDKNRFAEGRLSIKDHNTLVNALEEIALGRRTQENYVVTSGIDRAILRTAQELKDSGIVYDSKQIAKANYSRLKGMVENKDL